ncbi:hypothetical protein FOZ60_000748 [Perkinsus olseni]|uniref:Uncharacterized protein n=1 Tax=Perkinsus olseni TaxID=32597 RepID=A0A7J6P1K6_PEROL|nr:hypothetical protein FOZ60_000748 [Perkinsus olseni]
MRDFGGRRINDRSLFLNAPLRDKQRSVLTVSGPLAETLEVLLGQSLPHRRKSRGYPEEPVLRFNFLDSVLVTTSPTSDGDQFNEEALRKLGNPHDILLAMLGFVKVESLTPEKKYCGLQQVGFFKPAFYACIIFDYDSTSSATLGYNSLDDHSLTIGYDEVSVKEDGEVSLKRQGFTENDHPFPNVELRVRLVVDAEKKDTINMFDADGEILYTLTTEQCQRAASLRANCQTKPGNMTTLSVLLTTCASPPTTKFAGSARYDDVSVKRDGEISLKRQGFTENDHPFPNVELRVRLVVDAGKKDTINVVDAEEKILYTLTTEQCQRSLSLDADCQTEPAKSSRALRDSDGNKLPSGEYRASPPYEVHLSAHYEAHRFGQYIVSAKPPSTFVYNSGYTQLELAEAPGGYLLNMSYYSAPYSRLLFRFNLQFYYDPAHKTVVTNYFDKLALS